MRADTVEEEAFENFENVIYIRNWLVVEGVILIKTWFL